MNAVLLTSFIPKSTGSGGNIGAFGIASSIQASGFSVSVCYTGIDKISDQDAFSFDVTSCHTEDKAQKKVLVRSYLEKVKPDVVWVHPILEWKYFEPLNSIYPHVIVAGDPLDLIKKYRFKYDGATEPNLLRRAKLYATNQFNARQLYFTERKFIRHCFEKGIVAAYGVGDIGYRKKQLKYDVKLCELAFPNYINKVRYSGKKNFLILGNFNTIHTRYGIDFFLSRVWPIWKMSSLVEKSIIRMVGGGKYPEKRLGPPPANQVGLEFVGFADSILEEYENALAVLVAVPIKLGFRTRVLEAWAHGVPVIMDSSSQTGLPEAKDGENCLIASSPNEFVVNSYKIIESDEFRTRLAENGRKTFENHYLNLSKEVQERYESVSLEAIAKFKSHLAVSNVKD